MGQGQHGLLQHSVELSSLKLEGAKPPHEALRPHDTALRALSWMTFAELHMTFPQEMFLE